MGESSSAPTRLYRGLAAGERRAERRERLLESGLQLLGTEGWRATTVTAVCELARLTPRYFYESFRDRDELLVAIFDGIVGEVTDQVRGTLDAAQPQNMRETVRANIAAWITVATKDPRKGRVAFVEALGSETLMREAPRHRAPLRRDSEQSGPQRLRRLRPRRSRPGPRRPRRRRWAHRDHDRMARGWTRTRRRRAHRGLHKAMRGVPRSSDRDPPHIRLVAGSAPSCGSRRLERRPGLLAQMGGAGFEPA